MTSRAKFSWEPLTGGSLLLRVTQDEKDTTWKVSKRTSSDRLITILWEVQEALAIDKVAGASFALPQRVAVRGPLIDSGGVEYRMNDEVTEEMSRAALAAKAAKVSVSLGGKWFENIDESDDDLPMYVIGHGEEES